MGPNFLKLRFFKMSTKIFFEVSKTRSYKIGLGRRAPSSTHISSDCRTICVMQGIIPVEGLVLDDVPPGLHQLHCLPLKLIGADGAPVRCVIMGS